MRVGKHRHKTGKDCMTWPQANKCVWLLETEGQSLSRAPARAELAKALDMTFWPPEL